MAAIDREILREDVKFWLPKSNTLSGSEIDRLDEMIIAKVGDDDSNYDEVLVLSIQLAAKKNSYDFVVSSSQIKKKKLGTFEVENFKNETLKNEWADWLKYKYPDICNEIGFTAHLANVKYFQIYFTPKQPDIDIFDGQLNSLPYSSGG